MIVYVVERSLNGTSKRIPATTLFNFLEQANIKVQLSQIGVARSVPRTELSPAQLKQLQQNAPTGTVHTPVHVTANVLLHSSGVGFKV